MKRLPGSIAAQVPFRWLDSAVLYRSTLADFVHPAHALPFYRLFLIQQAGQRTVSLSEWDPRFLGYRIDKSLSGLIVSLWATTYIFFLSKGKKNCGAVLDNFTRGHCNSTMGLRHSVFSIHQAQVQM